MSLRFKYKFKIPELFIILCLIFFFLTTYGAIVIDGRYLAVKHKIAFDFNSFSLNSFPFFV